MRRDAWWHLPAAVLATLAFPLRWLWQLPGALRWDRLAARARRDVDLARVRGYHAWTREVPSIASGSEDEWLLELELAGGERVVVDDPLGEVRRAMARRGIAAWSTRSLGKHVGGLGWVAWLSTMVVVITIVLVVIVIVRAC